MYNMRTTRDGLGCQTGSSNPPQQRTPQKQDLIQQQVEKCEKIIKRPEVNFNVLPGEVILYCPYYANHFFRDSRAVYHLTNCREQYVQERKRLGKPVDVNICPHFYKHHVPLAEWDAHIKECNSIVQRELNSICDVLPSDMAPVGFVKGSYQYTVPGTAEVITRRGGIGGTPSKPAVAKASSGEYAWEDMNWGQGCKLGDEGKLKKSDTSEGTIEIEDDEIPGSASSEPKLEEQVERPKIKAPFSYMESVKNRQHEVQPIGLTKKQRRDWQAANLAKVKKSIKEDEAREFFTAHNRELLERERYVPRDD